MTELAPASDPQGTRVPWGIASGAGSFILAFAIYITGVSLLFRVEHVSITHHALTWDLAAYQILAGAVILCVLLFVVMPYHVGLRALGYRLAGSRILVVAGIALVATFAGIALLQVAFNTFFPAYHLRGNAVEELGAHHHYGFAKDLLVLGWAAIEAPLTEETLFRGILFQGLRHVFHRFLPFHLAVFLAAVVSGTLFGLAHGEIHSAPILIFMGIILAYVFQFGRSIYASVLVHGLINALAVIAILG